MASDSVMVLLLLFSILLSVIFSELATGGKKLQTHFLRVFFVQALVGFLCGLYLNGKYGIRAVPIFLFYTGVFVSWFGVRSHLESSILLQLMILLRDKQQTATQLVETYESYYGETQRLEELMAGGFLKKLPEGMVVTKRGNWVLRIVSLLR